MASLPLGLALASLACGAAGAAAPARPEAARISLVLVDAASEKALGWPLPLPVLAAAVERIASGQPHAVVLKFFIDPEAEGAGELAKTMAKHGNVLLQCAGADSGAAPEPALRPFRLPGSPGADFDDHPAVTLPAPSLVAAAAGVGFVHVKLDPATGAAERWQVVSMAGGRHYASLPLLVLARERGIVPGSLRLSKARGGWALAAPGLRLALDHEGAVPIRFSESRARYGAFPFVLVHGGRIPPSAFKDRVVVVGPDLPARADNGLKTPRGEAYSKVLLFADALATLSAAPK
ncbi:MAG: CHASE2 domain-containing protein [Elusimicrobia bacterium]|nr:CHASE2 domain-containing protein [Elusimicrobiota bacterium]